MEEKTMHLKMLFINIPDVKRIEQKILQLRKKTDRYKKSDKN